jgi:hypothetical protein
MPMKEGDAGWKDVDGVLFCEGCKEFYAEIMEDIEEVA